MIYKNDSSKENVFIHKYLIRMISIFSFAIIFNFCLFYFMLPIANTEYKNTVWIYLIIFPLLAVYCAVLTFVFLKKNKKNFREYTFEITDNEIIVNENKLQKIIKISEIKEIRKIKEKKILIIGNAFSRIYTSEYLENAEEVFSRLSEITDIKKDKKEKVITILTWIIFIGFFIARFIPNVYVYIIFGTGFLVMSVISIYLLFCSSIKLWTKIIMIIFYGYTNFWIIMNIVKLIAKMCS